ncbi:MAG: peroxidase family protein [Bacteroidota bacterium]
MKQILLSGLLLGLLNSGFFAQNVDTDIYRTIDGRFNNPDHEEWGAAHSPLIRFTGNGFADSISVPPGIDRPNPRTISNTLFAQEGLVNDPMTLSDFTWVFGQFIDHDVALTEHPGEPFDIQIPAGDPQFDPVGTGSMTIGLLRNAPIEGTGLSPDNPRQYDNDITAFIDGSAVYHSEQEAADWLRTFEGGKLKTSAGGLLPYNTIDGEFDSEIDPTAPHMADPVGFAPRLFVAGDLRVNENPLLIAMHTLFVLEHNRQADLIAAANPDWTDEEIYQYARKMVSGLIQSIVYDEWLPAMGVNLEPYSGYDPTVVPQLANVFSAAAFRMGHTLLNGNIRRTDEYGEILPEGNLDLRHAFFNPMALPDVGGLEPYLRGMAEQNQQKFDGKVIDDVRNFLFGPPGAGGMDLVAINIQRGRERGLPTFNEVRLAYGLSPYTFVEQINDDLEVAGRLSFLYGGDIRKVDPWVGMLTEKSMPGAIFGETVLRIMEVQFRALRDGDRFFYLNDPLLTDEEKDWITTTTFRDIIMYNTDIAVMQDNVFLTTEYSEVCASMTIDVDGGVLVQGTWDPLFDTRIDVLVSGNSVNNNITGGLGVYGFEDLAACDQNIISPSREDTWLNGLTVQDLVIITRHILQIQEFDSPYQYLAADVNFDEDVSVIDIVQIRRLILDLQQQFDDGNPWRFVGAAHEFPDLENPWLLPIPSVLNLSQINAADYDQGFVAYKLGDVNSSADLTIGGSLVEDGAQFAAMRYTSPDQLDIAFVDREVEAGEVFDLKFMVAGNTQEIDGFQFALDFGDNLVQQAPADFEFGEAFYGNQGYDNVLRLVGEPINGAATHFHVLLRATRDMRLSDEIRIAGDFPSVAMDYDDLLHEVSLAPGAPEDLMDKIPPFTFFPNPFEQQLRIRFDEPIASAGEVQLADPLGRVLMTVPLSPGTTDYNLEGDVSWPAGHYCYRVNVDGMEHKGCVVKH